jgi:hypothetical protein
MALTDLQRRIYASAPVRSVVRQALVLSHPGFSRTFYLTNQPISFFGVFGGATREFVAVPFEVVEPRRDDTAQQDLRISIDNVDPALMIELERAALDFSEAITCTFLVFADDDPRPQDTPLVLFLTALKATATAVIGTATRADVVNAEFPRRYYRVNEFPGMAR